MSTELHTLSGAFALDALSAEEAALFETHLEQCPACRDEVRELRAAAARMGASEAAVPPGALRERVLAAVDRVPQLPPRVTAIERARRRGWVPRVVAAAAAVLLVAGVGVGIAQRGDDGGSAEATAVTQVFRAQDAHTATVSTDHGKLTVATSPGMGRMAVETAGLRRLPKNEVYQLWTMHGTTATSVGVLHDLGAGAAMSMPSSGTTVAITVEPEGGSERPTTSPIVTVDPESV